MTIEFSEDANGKTYLTRYYDVMPESIRLYTRYDFRRRENLHDNPHMLTFVGRQKADKEKQTFDIQLTLNTKFKIFAEKYENESNLLSGISAEILKNNKPTAILHNLCLHIRSSIYYETINSTNCLDIRIKFTCCDIETNNMQIGSAKSRTSVQFTAFKRIFDLNGHTLKPENENIFDFRLFQERADKH